MKARLSVLIILLLAAAPALAATATARLDATQPDGLVSGLATFEDTTEGLRVIVTVYNATPGSHAIHVHEFGACGDGGNQAGSHYNPHGAPHGHILSDGPAKAHAGDLGNIEVGPDGIGRLEIILPGAALQGERAAIGGKSLVLHEKEDDFVGQPSGNAGGRIACGVILTAQ